MEKEAPKRKEDDEGKRQGKREEGKGGEAG